MNSVIISFVCALCASFAEIFKKSGIYKLFMRIYTAFSVWWDKSVVMNWIKREKYSGVAENSVLYKIIRLPFELAENIQKKMGAWLAKEAAESVFLNIARCFTNNALSLNTGFLGCAALGAVLAGMAVTQRVTPVSLFAAVVGVVFVLTDYNITDFFAGSGIVKFFLKLAGFEDISWNFYKKEYTKKRSALVLAVIIGAGAGILASRSYILALALPVGITGMCVVFSYPVTGVFFALFAAPFVPTMILAALCVLTFAALVIKTIMNGEFRWRVDGVGCGLGFFLIFMLISSVFSFAVKKSVLVWGMYFIFVGFYFVIINTIKTKEQLISLLKLFVIAGLFVSLYGILQYVFGWNTSNAWIDEEMFEQATMRAYSTMENPNVLGEYLLLIIPLSAAFMLRKGAKGLEKCFFAGIFALSALCMVFTQSRGCWLGLLLAACIFVTFYNGKLWGLLPIALIILPFVIPQTMVDRLMSVGNLEDSSTSYRVFIWRGTFAMLRDFWIGGIGMGEGAFRSVYPLYSFNAIIAPHSHNTFLQLVVEGGAAALAVFAITVCVFIKKLSCVYRQAGKNSDEAIAALAIGSGVIGFLLQSLFDYTFYNYRMMAMFFMIMAVGISLYYIGGERKNDG